jgi:serine/threonine-protein kinase HipA
MKNQGSPHVLDVYLKEIFIGKLTTNNATLSFVYDPTYLQRLDAIKLSASMPLQKQEFDNTVTAPFFSGLLPDEGVRQRLAHYLGLSEKNTFALLKEIGGECAGAVSVYPEGLIINRNKKPTYRILGGNEAAAILSSLDKKPLLAGDEDVRISGAGAQDKLMIALIDGKIAIPINHSPSTHIIKPAIKGFDDSVHNEFFCMKAAKAVNLPVPEVSIYWLDEKPYYLVERYDRKFNKDGSITRLHQEDFCQALHIPPEIKYENEGGPTLTQCFTLLDERIHSGAMAGRNKLTLLHGIIFNYLIGNGDAHGKNFSLLYEGDAESLAPFYDLLSTIVYGNVNKSKMAMKIQGHYKFKDIFGRHWVEFGKMLGFREDFTKRQIIHMGKNLEEKAECLCLHLNDDLQTASTIYEKILEIIRLNNRRLVNFEL